MRDDTITLNKSYVRGDYKMTKLSKRQQAILDYIKEEVQTKGYPPSVREIAVAVGLASSSTVHGHLSRLEGKGYRSEERRVGKECRSGGCGCGLEKSKR